MRRSCAWGRPERPAGDHPELWLTCAPPSDGACRLSPTADATQSAATAASNATAARPMPMIRISCSLAFPVIAVPSESMFDTLPPTVVTLRGEAMPRASDSTARSTRPTGGAPRPPRVRDFRREGPARRRPPPHARRHPPRARGRRRVRDRRRDPERRPGPAARRADRAGSRGARRAHAEHGRPAVPRGDPPTASEDQGRDALRVDDPRPHRGGASPRGERLRAEDRRPERSALHATPGDRRHRLLDGRPAGELDAERRRRQPASPTARSRSSPSSRAGSRTTRSRRSCGSRSRR